MKPEEVGRVFARAEESFARATSAAARTDRAVARANNVLERIDARRGVAGDAARRERRRLNSGLFKTLGMAGAAMLVVLVATIVIGFVQPIGLFGFLGAIGLALFVAGAILLAGTRRRALTRPALDAALPAAALVERLDSYLYRARPALPPPAQAEIDRMLSALPELKPTLERVGTAEPAAQDARRLMSTHLPNLIDRYLNVPRHLRTDPSEEVTVDQRLVDALRTGREALEEAGKTLAKGDVAAFETQGRFIESRYGEPPLDR